MEAVAVDKLMDKGGATRQFAQAIGEALDITLKAANFVTVPVLDARFAQFEAKMEARFGAMEARFGSLERAVESAKVWAVLLYAGLAIVFFGALAVEHRWVVNREDEFMAVIQARSDARFAAEDARTDKLFAEDHARRDALLAEEQAQSDKLFAEEHARSDRLIAEERARTDKLIAEQREYADKLEARLESKFDKLRALLVNRSRNP